MRVNDDERTVAAMDVLAPGIGEIVGGSQREERLDILDARIRETGLDPAVYWWYRDLRRYGTVPHAGFGLGFDRTVVYATGMANVRDVIPFPRTPRARLLAGHAASAIAVPAVSRPFVPAVSRPFVPSQPPNPRRIRPRPEPPR